MTVAVYLRISEDRLGLELGVDRQREDCRKLATGRGWPDPEEFADNDMSATTGRRRPGYEALMAAVDAGEVKRIIVWHTSRIWRNRRERADGIERLRAARVSLLAVKGPELDMATAAGRGLAGLLGEFDTMESETKAERSVREVLQRAERGAHHGGPRAYGYTANGAALVPAEAQALERWYGELLAGRSLSSIAREAGKHHSAMRVILLNPRNAGLRVLHGAEYAGAWPAIVPVEVWRDAVDLLTHPDRRTNTARVARRWLGSGLYLCERCDGRPVGITGRAAAHGGGGVYCCLPRRGGCSRSWDAARLDEFVVDLVAARLGRPDVADLLPRERPDLDALRTEAAAARRRLSTLAGGWAVGELTDEQLRTATAKLRGRLAEIEQVLGDAGRGGALAAVVLADDPAAKWLEIGDVPRRQAIVRSLMTVTLGAGPRGRAPWDAEQFVTVGWRQP